MEASLAHITDGEDEIQVPTESIDDHQEAKATPSRKRCLRQPRPTGSPGASPAVKKGTKKKNTLRSQVNRMNQIKMIGRELLENMHSIGIEIARLDESHRNTFFADHSISGLSHLTATNCELLCKMSDFLGEIGDFLNEIK
jgi:hypothetical protein